MVGGWSASASLHHALVTVMLLRLLSVAGVALIAYCIPKLARSYGRDPGPAFVLAVLNPLVLLTLVGGAHNDAIMVGLLVAGITAAQCGTRCGAWCCAPWPPPSRRRPPSASSTSAWDWAGPRADCASGSGTLVTAGLVTGGGHGGPLAGERPRVGLGGQPRDAGHRPLAGWPRPPASGWLSAAPARRSGSGSAWAACSR